jgi:hypothetical protein
MAELFDIAADPANGMQYHAEEIDCPANRVFSAPRSAEELTQRRHAIETWAKHTHGWVGRSPDHVGTFFAAFGTHPEVFADEERDFAGNIRNFYKRILAETSTSPTPSFRRRSRAPRRQAAATGTGKAWPSTRESSALSRTSDTTNSPGCSDPRDGGSRDDMFRLPPNRTDH